MATCYLVTSNNSSKLESSILDSGANNIFFPFYDSQYMKNYQSLPPSHYLKTASKHKLPIVGKATLGPFQVYIVPGLHSPLISESYLVKNFNIIIIRYNTSTWILDSIKANNCHTNTDSTDYIIAKADLSNDGLYRMNNIFDLIQSNPKPKHCNAVSFQSNPQQFSAKAAVTETALNRGRYQGRFSHLLGALNPLEILKVRLGFLNVKHLRDLVKVNGAIGIGTTTSEIKNTYLGSSLAEYQGRMHAFPIYPSLSLHNHDHLFETWSVDPVPMPIKSLEGYIGYFSFVEKKIKFRHVQGYRKSVAELPKALDLLKAKYGHRANSRAKPMKMIIFDGSTTHLGKILKEYCDNTANPDEPIIQRCVSAPYKHQQNLSESHIHHEKNAMRTALAYNQAPLFLWYKALRYQIKNTNLQIVPGTKMTRQEAMTGLKPDISHYVPFYATGYALVHKEERNNTLTYRARDVKMIGYADDLDEQIFPNQTYKQSYQCYIPPSQVIIRHDVIWDHLAPRPSLLNSEAKSRFPDTIELDKEILKEMERRFPNETSRYTSIQSTAQVPNPIIQYEIEPDDDEADDYAEPNQGIRTRAFYEPNYWYAEMARTGMLKSAIFQDATSAEATSSNEDDNKSTSQSESTTSTIIDSPILNTEDNGHIDPPNSDSTSDSEQSSERRTWLKTMFNPTYTHNQQIQNSDLSQYPKAHMMVGSNGSITISNNELPQSVIRDIMHDYNRVIRQIIVDDCTKTDHKYYQEDPKSFNSYSYLNHPSKRPKTLRHQRHKHDLPYYHSYTAAQQRVMEAAYNPEPPVTSSTTPILHLPLTLEEALSGKDGIHWKLAWEEEMTKLAIRNTWRTMPEKESPPQNQKPIKSKYIFKIKINRDGSLRYKVRLCACGYSQKYGIDYDETFAPTAKYKSLCTVLTIAAANNWILKGIDVENAFVEAPIDRPIYMNLPTKTYSHKSGKPITVELEKSLYGLKQAPELWDKFLCKAIKLQGFRQLMHDQCIFIKELSGDRKVILVKYVDDIIITGNNASMIESVLDGFEKSFTKMTRDEDVKRYVGIDIDYDRVNGSIRLSQKPFIQRLLQKYNINPQSMVDNNSFRTPINPTRDYRSPGDNTLDPMRDVTGNLRFLADRTLPNILASTSLLSSGAHNPSPAHKAGGEQALKYLNSHQDDYVNLGGDPHINLFGYADASHIMDHDSKSQLGFCFYLNETSGAVIAKSKRDTTISHSSTEAEIKAVDLAIREATWFRGFLSELGYPQNSPTVIYTDNKAATILAGTNNISDLTSHLVLRINYIHQEQKCGNIQLKWINTENNVADILTKALPFPIYESHSDTLMHGHNGLPPTISPFTGNDKKRLNKKKLQSKHDSKRKR